MLFEDNGQLLAYLVQIALNALSETNKKINFVIFFLWLWFTGVNRVGCDGRILHLFNNKFYFIFLPSKKTSDNNSLNELPLAGSVQEIIVKQFFIEPQSDYWQIGA